MSRARLEEHRALWAAKPALARLYSVWFDRLLQLAPARGTALEVGAGPGFLSEYARRERPGIVWVASDLAAAPWNDLAADASRLPFEDARLDLVAAVDLVHHLARPRDFFTEAARVLKPGGRLAVIEPWVTPFSYPIYRWLHQEGCDTSIEPWDPFAARGRTGKDAFDGNAAIPWRIVRHTAASEWAALGLTPPRVEVLNGFAYLLSLGFRRRSLLPLRAVPLLTALDAAAAGLARFTGMRALAVWERPG